MKQPAPDPAFDECLPATPTGKKPQQILAAARRQFMEHGFGAASMDAIARDAEVSKATLYAHFAGKEELFSAIVGGECRKAVDVLADAFEPKQDVRAVLTALGRKMISFLMAPQTLKFYRIVVADAGRFPELGRIFYESGPKLARGRLAAFLRRAHADGSLAVPDPEMAAEQFYGMVMGQRQLRTLLGFDPPDAAAREQAVQSAVEGFLRAYAPPARQDAGQDG